MTNEQQISRYLTALRASLGPVTLAEREEILREIESHIRDSSQEPGLAMEDVLARLGPPDQLAADYRTGLLIREASHSFSPLVLLRATLRVATKGFFGMLFFLSGLFGYFLGGGLILTAFVKPFLPTHTGLFVGPTNYGMGIFFPGTEAGQRELLGWWYIPIGLALGSLFLVLTTSAIRFFLRTSRRWQLRLGGIPHSTRHPEVAMLLALAVAFCFGTPRPF